MELKRSLAPMLWAFPVSFVFGIGVALSSALVQEEFHGRVLLGAVFALLGSLSAYAVQNRTLLQVLAVAVGLTWGALIGIAVVISINNQRVSVQWPYMLVGLAVIPFLASLLVAGPWYLARYRRRQIGEQQRTMTSRRAG